MHIRIVVSGGGTGGHVYPAIALAKLFDKEEDSTALLIGSASGLESVVAPDEGLEFLGLELKGVAGQRLIEKSRALTLFFTAVLKCRRLFRQDRPDVVIGTGGYASAPACFAAALSNIPLILHEMNYYPGLVTRVLSRRAHAVAAAFSPTAGLLSNKARVVTTGVPVREEIAALRDSRVRDRLRGEACTAFGLNPVKRTLLVFGGSQGAKALNSALIKAIAADAGREDLQVLHVTGRNDREGENQGVGEGGQSTFVIGYAAMEYCERMDLAYAVADLALCRAGAGTLAELKAASLPAVLVPYPYASGAHQEANALEFQREDAALVVPQDGESASEAVAEAFRLLDAPEKILKMRKRMLGMQGADGAEGIAALVEELR